MGIPQLVLELTKQVVRLISSPPVASPAADTPNNGGGSNVTDNSGGNVGSLGIFEIPTNFNDNLKQQNGGDRK